MNNKRCKHGFYTDPNGYHIIPKSKSTSELIEEANKLFRSEKPVTVKVKPKSKYDGDRKASKGH